MYYLDDAGLQIHDVLNIPLNELTLEKEPFLTAKDIQSLSVVTKKNGDISFFRFCIKDSVTTFSHNFQPFVMVLNGKRYLLGDFWPSMASFAPLAPLAVKMGNNNLELLSNSIGAKSSQIIESLQKLGVEVVNNKNK